MDTPVDDDSLETVREAAARLGTTVAAVHAMLSYSKLPAIRKGRRWYVPKDATPKRFGGPPGRRVPLEPPDPPAE